MFKLVVPVVHNQIIHSGCGILRAGMFADISVRSYDQNVEYVLVLQDM